MKRTINPATSSSPSSTSTWSRLKPLTIDPLENLGFPSKGDKRLLDFQTQETYYGEILKRCTSEEKAHIRKENDDDDDVGLDEALQPLSLDGGERTEPEQGSDPRALKEQTALDHLSHGPQSDTKALSVAVQAMRKLREAIVASGRTDAFAQRVYVFIVRATILTRQMESYHPTILHLLRKIHPRTPHAEEELREMVGFYVLDLACRQGELGEAYRVKFLYGYRDAKVEGVIRALVHGNWWLYFRLEGVMDRYQKRLMGWGRDGIGEHALKSVGQSYLIVEKGFLERATRVSWEELKLRNGIGWELDGEKVIIRKIKRK